MALERLGTTPRNRSNPAERSLSNYTCPDAFADRDDGSLSFIGEQVDADRLIERIRPEDLERYRRSVAQLRERGRAVVVLTRSTVTDAQAELADFINDVLDEAEATESASV